MAVKREPSVPPRTMVRLAARQQKNASPKELLQIAQEMGVEFIPCQMTMDMFGLTRDDLIEGMDEASAILEIRRLIKMAREDKA